MISENQFIGIIEKAESGDAESQYLLGIYYFDKNNKDRSRKKAVMWLEKAVKQDHIGAQKLLALYAKRRKLSYRYWLKWLENVAETGDTEALYELADYYYKEDKEKAYDIFKQLCDTNHVPSKCRLADFYMYGYVVRRNTTEALGLLEDAASSGYVEAMCRLEEYYADQEYTEENYSQAKKWYDMAISHGCNASVLHHKMEALESERKYHQKFNRLLKKAESGDSKAQYKIGDYYESNGDLKTSFYWYHRSAENGLAKAQWKIACFYNHGVGVEKNCSAAFEWAMKAALQENAAAMNFVGCFYADGNVVDKDLDRAKYWYTKSAEKGDRNAKYNLKHLYDDPSKEFINPDDVEHITLTPDNFEDYLPLNLVALSVAEPGAMGIEGDITMVSSDKKIYTLNYLYEDWDDDVVSSVTDMLGRYYYEVELGMGNNLYVSDTIWEDFSLTVDEDALQRMHYRTWIAVVLNIQTTSKGISLYGDDNPQSGWAIVFAGGSSSGKSTLIKNFSFRGEILSTDTFGEEQMDVHNNASWYAKNCPKKFEFAEKVVKTGLYSRFPNPRVLNKVPNLHLDFDTPTVTPQTLSALLSNGAHRYKQSYFKAHIDSCAKDGMKNLILDMTGKEHEVKLYTDYLHNKGYKVALVWVVTNRSTALLWNQSRRRAMKVSGVHAGHKGPNKWLLEGLQDGRCDIFEDAWLVFNSTESFKREMSDEEKSHSVIHLDKQNGNFIIDNLLAERITKVLGPLDESAYVTSAWMKKIFMRLRMANKVAAENGLPPVKATDFLVSFLEKDRKECEENIKGFYQRLGQKEPKMPEAPYECYDINEPVPEYFNSQSEYETALQLFEEQKTRYARSVKEWQEFNRQFEPSAMPISQKNNIKEERQMKRTNDILSYKYDFEKNPIEKYSKKIQEIAKTIEKAEASDVTPLTAFFDMAKLRGQTLCFFGAGGAASPATFATQLANEQGMVAMMLTPMAVMTLGEEVVKKMCFLAITASGGPVDMQAATEYLLKIAPEQVYCLTTNSLDHKSRFGKLDNKVGLMVRAYNPSHAICVNLSVHSDGFVGTNKHVGLSLLLYRTFHPGETNFAEKLLLPEIEPYEARLPLGMSLKDISDLHILYGALGRSAANDMEGRMLEAGVIPAMATDFKNFTHGRHVFLDKHPQSTILMLISPKDEQFISNMLALIPQERPIIFIRTQRKDMLGALQLMICTFYLSIDICAPLGINAYSPGAPKWGGKLWALKL